MPLIIPLNIKTEDSIQKEDRICDSLRGHCWVGGQQEIWTLNSNKTKVLQKAYYNKCVHCEAYVYQENI